tara:strand:- start:801 stop:1145 length:345 start_codon:yes stop_codon:yes gene_type:complete
MMRDFLHTTALVILFIFASSAEAAAPITFRCVDLSTKRAFQFEIPHDGEGILKIKSGFPVRSRNDLPMSGFGSKTSFRFGNEIEGGMFRNGIFYYHRHDTGAGTKVVNGTCRVI